MFQSDRPHLFSEPVHTSHSDVFTGGRTAEFERSCEATLCPGGAATLSVLDGKEHGGSCRQEVLPGVESQSPS